jgi:putative copper export protein
MGPVSELPVRSASWPDAPTTAGVATGIAVAATLMTCLLRPEIGRYLFEAIALVCALGAAGIAWYLARLSGQSPPAAALRTMTVRLAVVAFAAALLTLPFAVMDVSGDGLRGLGDGLARSVALRGGDYQSIVARSAGLVLLVGALRLRRSSPAALVVSAALIVGSFLLMGHVRTHDPRAAVLATTLAHVGAAAAWFGGLLGLGFGLRTARGDPRASGQLLAAFARMMSVVLLLLVAAGIGLSVLYLPSPGALVHTAYGEVLLVKLAVVATTLVLSAANHNRLVPAAETGNMTAVRVLRVNIAAEQALLITVLGITEILMRQNPGG